jgi:hypothetical protein
MIKPLQDWRCLYCGAGLEDKQPRGNIPKYCDSRCKQRYYRFINSPHWAKKENCCLDYLPIHLANDRAVLNLTTTEVSEKLGIPHQLYNRYENGHLHIPNVIFLSMKGLISLEN